MPDETVTNAPRALARQIRTLQILNKKDAEGYHDLVSR